MTNPQMPRRRHGDKWLPRIWHHLVPVLSVGLVVWALAIATDANNTARHAAATAKTAVTRVQNGRSTSLGFTCAALSAISEAGRQVIVGSAAPPESRFTRALERLGYPPRKVRIQQAQQAGVLYVQSISGHVRRELATRGEQMPKRLIRADGTIDCQLLSELADIPAAPTQHAITH